MKTMTLTPLDRIWHGDPAVMAALWASTQAAMAAGTQPPAPEPLTARLVEPAAAQIAGKAHGLEPESTPGVVAVLPLQGTIHHRSGGGGFFSFLFGGTSTEAFAQVFRGVMHDPNVKAVVIDVNSPGGTVAGVPELADVIFEARGAKPVIAVANALAASAAYWIAAQADELVITPSGGVGSVGVFAMHEDFSKFLEMEGVDVTLLHAGRRKIEANHFEPLGDEARAAIQDDLDRIHGEFIAALARGRGVSEATVRADFGEGRVIAAEQAVALGMADRVGTLEDAIDRALRTASGPARPGARAGQLEGGVIKNVVAEWDPNEPELDVDRGPLSESDAEEKTLTAPGPTLDIRRRRMALG